MTDSGKSYHKSCTGAALETVQKHSKKSNITFFGACFCPFVQRVWAAFEYLEIPYHVGALTVALFSNSPHSVL